MPMLECTTIEKNAETLLPCGLGWHVMPTQYIIMLTREIGKDADDMKLF